MKKRNWGIFILVICIVISLTLYTSYCYPNQTSDYYNLGIYEYEQYINPGLGQWFDPNPDPWRMTYQHFFNLDPTSWRVYNSEQFWEGAYMPGQGAYQQILGQELVFDVRQLLNTEMNMEFTQPYTPQYSWNPYEYPGRFAPARTRNMLYEFTSQIPEQNLYPLPQKWQPMGAITDSIGGGGGGWLSYSGWLPYGFLGPSVLY